MTGHGPLPLEPQLQGEGHRHLIHDALRGFSAVRGVVAYGPIQPRPFSDTWTCLHDCQSNASELSLLNLATRCQCCPH